MKLTDLFKYLKPIDLISVDFDDIGRCILTFRIRFCGIKKFTNEGRGKDWYEIRPNGKIKKLSDYRGGKNFEEVMSLILPILLSNPHIKSYIRSKKLDLLT